jgi:hypothetical protein
MDANKLSHTIANVSIYIALAGAFLLCLRDALDKSPRCARCGRPWDKSVGNGPCKCGSRVLKA